MKSQKILVRNLPADGLKKRREIAVKPMMFLYGMLVAGFIFLFLSKPLALAGIIMICFGGFALIVLPDRTLISFSKDWMAVYNQHDRKECVLIYYEDIVAWQYEWHSNTDTLVIFLTDGTNETQEMYSKFRVQKLLNEYAPGKEKKSSRTKR